MSIAAWVLTKIQDDGVYVFGATITNHDALNSHEIILPEPSNRKNWILKAFGGSCTGAASAGTPSGILRATTKDGQRLWEWPFGAERLTSVPGGEIIRFGGADFDTETLAVAPGRGERLFAITNEFDTHGSPTADCGVFLRLRLR